MRHFPNLQRSFFWNNEPTSGFMFDVDDITRQVILNDETQKLNYELALQAVRDGSMTDEGILDVGTANFDAGAIRCPCGRKVELVSDWRGTRCECGREYGDTGQEFRANWRELCRETGELTDDDFL